MPTKPKQTKTAKASAKKPSKSSVSKKPVKPAKPARKTAAVNNKRPTGKPTAAKKQSTKASKPAQKTTAKPTKKLTTKPAAKKVTSRAKANGTSAKKAPAKKVLPKKAPAKLKPTAAKANSKATSKRTAGGIKASTKKTIAKTSSSKRPSTNIAKAKKSVAPVKSAAKGAKGAKGSAQPKKVVKAVASPKPTVAAPGKRTKLELVSNKKNDVATLKKKKKPNDDTADKQKNSTATDKTQTEQNGNEFESAKPTKAVKRGKPMNIISTGISSVLAEGEQVSAKPMQDREEELGEPEFKPVSADIAQNTMEKLCATYPNAECELTFKNDFELLIAVILSAQTTDANVNKVTPNLFRRFATPKALAEADENEIKQIIKSTGYFNSKTKNIQACARAIMERFGGNVPTNRDDLTTLPGVGRKTANVVLGVAHDVPGWTVDTHVQRLAFRLGFSGESDPYKIEMDLDKLFPEKDWSKYSITLIWHGRRCCFARNPNCEGCPVNNQCPSSRV